jgi:hypothetical protein
MLDRALLRTTPKSFIVKRLERAEGELWRFFTSQDAHDGLAPSFEKRAAELAGK